MEIFAIYIPAIGLNIYDIFFYKLGEQIFYIGVDSLFLIVYATILITIILCQREKVLHPMILFDWKELLRFNVASDDEKLYTYD
jgi:tellurite resistance protein TehA-like permease